MTKIDRLRRQREEQHERQQAQLRAPAGSGDAKSAKVTAPAAAAPPAILETRRPKAAADALEGACPACGKVRPLTNGLVSNHQKGLGKMCPGSRKEPA